MTDQLICQAASANDLFAQVIANVTLFCPGYGGYGVIADIEYEQHDFEMYPMNTTAYNVSPQPMDIRWPSAISRTYKVFRNKQQVLYNYVSIVIEQVDGIFIIREVHRAFGQNVTLAALQLFQNCKHNPFASNYNALAIVRNISISNNFELIDNKWQWCNVLYNNGVIVHTTKIRQGASQSASLEITGFQIRIDQTSGGISFPSQVNYFDGGALKYEMQISYTKSDNVVNAAITLLDATTKSTETYSAAYTIFNDTQRKANFNLHGQWSFKLKSTNTKLADKTIKIDYTNGAQVICTTTTAEQTITDSYHGGVRVSRKISTKLGQLIYEEIYGDWFEPTLRRLNSQTAQLAIKFTND